MKPANERLMPFYDIAVRKGKKITFFEVGDTSCDDQSYEQTKIHLDMDMVEASLADAISQAREKGSDVILKKLIRLRENGTDAEKINFVFSSGTYYFPEDLASMAAEFRAGVVTEREKVCEPICYEVCRCVMLGPDKVVEQLCRELCKTICALV